MSTISYFNVYLDYEKSNTSFAETHMRAVLNLSRLVQEFVPWPHVVEQADHVYVTHSNLFSGGVSEGCTTLLKSKSIPGFPPWT